MRIQASSRTATRTAHLARRGFTLVEMAIVATILVLLTGALVSSLESMRDVTLTSSVESRIQEAGERAMRQIVSDMRRSGQVSVGGVDYPGFFDDGAAAGNFAAHAHPAAIQNAAFGEPGFGASREIVFLLPRDDDTWGPPAVPGTPDGIPDLDGNADLIWGPTEFSYVLVTGPDGINRLERRADGAAPTMVASFVERIVFNDMSTDPLVLPSAVHIQLFLRQADTQGLVHRYQAEATVLMRNGN